MINLPNINKHLPLDKAELIAFFLETLFYGVSALLFAITIWVLVYHRKTEKVNKSLIATSCVMMAIGTLHLAIDLTRILQGFIYERDLPGGPVGYFSQLWLWSHVSKTFFFALQTVLADSFATYRCWVVWRRPWAAIIPGCFVCGTLATSMTVVQRLSAIDSSEEIFSGDLASWITSFFTLTLSTNVLCTSLIAFRIWFSNRKVERYAGRQEHSLMPVVIIIIESGAIYSVSCLTLLVSYILGSNAQYPALDGTFPIISIVFNLIIVRVGLGIAHGGSASLRSVKPTSELTAPNFEAPGNQTQYPLKPLAVTVTKLVHQDRDQESKDRESINSEGKWNAV